MSKKILDRAPLVHAVLHLRFSETPSLNPINTELLNKLHERMIKEGFQEKIESQATLDEVIFDPVKQQMNHKQLNKKRILFRATGEKSIVEISEESIVLKTTNYNSFEEFYGSFHLVLTGCLEVLNGLSHALLKSIGLRYVDIIAPANNLSLNELVSAELLPASLEIINESKHIQGATLKVVATNPRQVLAVNFEELLVREGKVSKILPDNLVEPDTKCGLKITGQSDWLNVSSETYGLLDIDHTHHFDSSPVFDVEMIQSAALELYQHANDVFWNSITEKAQQEWGVRHVE
jgi:uncharacterized protein (TIGR04255 family)